MSACDDFETISESIRVTSCLMSKLLNQDIRFSVRHKHSGEHQGYETHAFLGHRSCPTLRGEEMWARQLLQEATRDEDRVNIQHVFANLDIICRSLSIHSSPLVAFKFGHFVLNDEVLISQMFDKPLQRSTISVDKPIFNKSKPSTLYEIDDAPGIVIPTDWNLPPALSTSRSKTPDCPAVEEKTAITCSLPTKGIEYVDAETLTWLHSGFYRKRTYTGPTSFRAIWISRLRPHAYRPAIVSDGVAILMSDCLRFVAGIVITHSSLHHLYLMPAMQPLLQRFRNKFLMKYILNAESGDKTDGIHKHRIQSRRF